MPTREPEVLCETDFTMTIVHAMCVMELQKVSSGGPGEKATVYWIYRNGTGDDQGRNWNVYLYDRDDTLPDGTERPAGTKQTDPPIPGLFHPNSITPETPKLLTKPQLSDAEVIAWKGGDFDELPVDVHVGENETDTYWIGSAVFYIPNTLNNGELEVKAIHESVVFYGAVEMY